MLIKRKNLGCLKASHQHAYFLTTEIDFCGLYRRNRAIARMKAMPSAIERAIINRKSESKLYENIKRQVGRINPRLIAKSAD